jgi:cytochrome c oxidase subunit IV
MAQSHQVTQNVIVSIKLKLAAFAVAVAIISILAYHYGFNGYVLTVGIVAYIIAKAVLWLYHAR